MPKPLHPRLDKTTRAERRAQEREDRRRSKRPTFEDVKREIEQRRDAEMLRLHLGNDIPIGHPYHRDLRLERTFAPLETLLDEVEQTGEVDVGPDGKPVLKHKDEYAYFPLVPSLTHMVDVFEMISSDKGVPLESDGLRRLISKWDYGMMLAQSDLDAARAGIRWMRALLAPLTPEQFSEYNVVVSTRHELARIDQEARLQRRRPE